MKQIILFLFLTVVMLYGCSKSKDLANSKIPSVDNRDTIEGSYIGNGRFFHESYNQATNPQHVVDSLVGIDTFSIIKMSDSSFNISYPQNTIECYGVFSDSNTYFYLSGHTRFTIKYYSKDSITFSYFSGSYGSTGQSEYSYDFSGKKIH